MDVTKKMHDANPCCPQPNGGIMEEYKCRYCHDIKEWIGDAPLPEPLRLGDKGIVEIHCDYPGAPSPRFTFTCPVCR